MGILIPTTEASLKLNNFHQINFKNHSRSFIANILGYINNGPVKSASLSPILQFFSQAPKSQFLRGMQSILLYFVSLEMIEKKEEINKIIFFSVVESYRTLPLRARKLYVRKINC